MRGHACTSVQKQTGPQKHAPAQTSMHKNIQVCTSVHSHGEGHAGTERGAQARSPCGDEEGAVEAQHALEVEAELGGAVVPPETPEAGVGGGGWGTWEHGDDAPGWPRAPSPGPRSPASPTVLRGTRSRGKDCATPLGAPGTTMRTRTKASSTPSIFPDTRRRRGAASEPGPLWAARG